MLTPAIQKHPLSTVHNCCNKEKNCSKTPYMLSSRSVIDGVSLSKSKLVERSLIFVDNKLTLICLLI